MNDFFSNDIYWKSYIVDNLLVKKMLYDRGLNVDNLRIWEPMLASVLDILFSDVSWEIIDPEISEEYQLLYDKLENGEELNPDEEDIACYINSYVSRDHYRIEVKIDDLAELYDKIQVGDFCRLMKLKKICSSFSDMPDAFWYELAQEIEWLKDDTGKVIGFWMHFIDVEPCTEEPVPDLVYNEAFIEFWDTLQDIKEVNKNSASANRGERQCVCEPGGERGDKGKANQPGLLIGTGERHVA